MERRTCDVLCRDYVKIKEEISSFNDDLEKGLDELIAGKEDNVPAKRNYQMCKSLVGMLRKTEFGSDQYKQILRNLNRHTKFIRKAC